MWQAKWENQSIAFASSPRIEDLLKATGKGRDWDNEFEGDCSVWKSAK